MIQMVKRTNEQWLADLSAEGEARELALADLAALLARFLPIALSRWLSSEDSRLEALVEETVQETLLKILDRLDTFEGRSQFTTWVFKIGVRIALTDLRRRRWKNISLEALEGGWDNEEGPPIHLAIDPQVPPDQAAERNDIIRRVETIMNEALTPRQRQVLVMMGVHGIPGDQVAAMLKTNRNALYKMMHDARARLKRQLESRGLSPEDLMSIFSRE